MLTDYLKDPSFYPQHEEECLANYRGIAHPNIGRVSLQYTTPANTFWLQHIYVSKGDVYLANQPNPEHFVGQVDAIQ